MPIGAQRGAPAAYLPVSGWGTAPQAFSGAGQQGPLTVTKAAKSSVVFPVCDRYAPSPAEGISRGWQYVLEPTWSG